MSLPLVLLVALGSISPTHWGHPPVAPTPTEHAGLAPAPGPRRVALAAREWKKRMREIKKLYLRGRYEELLPLIDQLKARKLNKSQKVTVLRYEAFVLYLMKLHGEAADTWKALLAVNPTYELSPDDASPEFIAFFKRIKPNEPHEPRGAHGPDDPQAPSQEPADRAQAGDGKAESEASPAVAAAQPSGAAPESAASPTGPPSASEGAPAEASASSTGGELSPATESPPPSNEGEGTNTETLSASPGTTTAALTPPAESLAVKLHERGCGILLCLIPGGVGQYANGQIVKGVIFTVLQTGALATNLAMYWGPDIGDPEAQLIVQRTAMVTAIAAAALGILDAFLFY